MLKQTLKHPRRITMVINWHCKSVLEADCLYHCYLILLKKKGRNKYMGSKIGYPDGTYHGTAVTHAAAMKKDLANYDFEYQVLFTGTEAECRKFEQDYLHGNDAKMSKEFYNESNSGAFKAESKFFIECLEALQSKFYKTGDYTLKVILGWDTYQVREEDGVDSSHVKKIYDKLMDDPSFWTGELSEKHLIVLEDFKGKGKHTRLSKNHTCAAGKRYFGEDSDVTLPVIFIPKSMWSKLVETELQEIGQLDNAEHDFKPKAQDTTTIVNSMVQYCKETNKKHDDPVVTVKLKRHGFTSNVLKSLKSKIKKQLLKPSGLAPNEKFVPTPKAAAEQEAIDEYKDKNTHCIPVTSGMYRSFFDTWSKSLSSKAVRSKKDLVILYYHTGIESWNNHPKKEVEFRKQLEDLNNLIQAQGGSGYNFIFRTINPIQKKTLLETPLQSNGQ